MDVGGISGGESLSFSLCPSRDNAGFIVNNPCCYVPRLEQYKSFGARRGIRDCGPTRCRGITEAAELWPVPWGLSLGRRLHVVFTVDRFDMLVESELRVIYDVDKLIFRTRSLAERRVD